MNARGRKQYATRITEAQEANAVIAGRALRALRDAGYSAGRMAGKWNPSEPGYVLGVYTPRCRYDERTPESRLYYIDHAGTGRTKAMLLYESVLRDAGLPVFLAPYKNLQSKQVLFVDIPIVYWYETKSRPRKRRG